MLCSQNLTFIAQFHLIFSPFIDQLNGNTTGGLAEDYTQHNRRSPSPASANEVIRGHVQRHERSRSRSPRGYLSVRRSPELRESAARSVSPSREAIQAAAREAAEQAIHLADAEDRKSPNDHHATGKINLDSF